MTDEYNTETTAVQDLDSGAGVPPTSGPLWRRVLSYVLAVITIVTIVLSVVVGWEKAVVQDEDQFVAALQGLPSEDAVATALSTRISERIVERTGVRDFVVEVLPDPLGFLATPLTTAISKSVNEITYDVITSDGFATVWSATLRITHRSASVLLSGNDGAIVSEEGTVSIDLNEIADLAVTRVESRGITLPDLDIDFGEVVLYESDQLAAAQTIAAAMDTMGWLVPVVALLLILATLWAAFDRRRMAAFLGFGTALGLLIFLALLRTGRNAIFGGVEDVISRDAGLAVWDTLVAVLVGSAWAVLVLALIVGIAAWAMGPSPRAKRISAWTKATLGRWGERGGGESSAVGRFFHEWKRPIEIGVVVLASLYILFGPAPSGLSVLITAVVGLAIIGVVEIVAGPSRDTDAEMDEAEVG